jgi:alanine dehydrogenase
MYRIGIPKEQKAYERRVSIVPSDVKRLLSEASATAASAVIYVQSNAGREAGYSNADYMASGAVIVETIQDLYENADIIVKVKEPQPSEYPYITSRHTIMAFFHFAGNIDLIHAMVASRAKCYAYETIQDDNGVYPILSPMSIIAGKQAMLKADGYLKDCGKKNKYNIVTIIGVGNVGKAAAEQAILMGYKYINLIDNDYAKIKRLEESNPSIYKAYEMNEQNLKKTLIFSNIVISSVYNNGMKASSIITNKLLDLMSNTGSIIMDVAIDQGGTTEQSVPMTLQNPMIRYNNTSIYCVPNIPSTEPTEASIKLSNAIYPYLHSLLGDADAEYSERSERNDPHADADARYLRELQKGLYMMT